jgi:hypothetical protein
MHSELGARPDILPLSMVQKAHFLPLYKGHAQTPFAAEIVQPSLSSVAIDWLIGVSVVGTLGGCVGLVSSWLKDSAPGSSGISTGFCAKAGETQ